MKERGKAIAMDLVFWFLAFLGSTNFGRFLTERPKNQVLIPLLTTDTAAALVLNGRQLSKGSGFLIRRSDL
jgi:hypothetical protein